MAEREFPRQNLNASAAPWGRAVERLIRDALRRLDQIDGSLDGTQNAAIRALRKIGADPDIYRDEGIVARAGTEFAIFTGREREDGAGVFSSLNVLPDKAVQRFTDEDGNSAFVITSAEYRRDNTPNGTVVIGVSPGTRYNDWAGVSALELSVDLNGMPLVQLAKREAPLLTLGYEDPTPNANGGYDQRPYMQWANDEAHRIYGFSDLAGAVPAGDEAQAGRVRFATDAETIAGTIGGKATTPRGVKKAIAAAITAAGTGTGTGKPPVDYWRGDWAQP